MSHYAIVIGVSEYASKNLNLTGADDDAIEMAKWLVDPAGGNVPAGRVVLLLSPQPASLPAELQRVWLDVATRRNVSEHVHDMAQKAASPGDRFYFYFSGHGITAPTDLVEEAILPQDFTDAQPDQSLGIRSMLQWCQTAQFEQQFFFIDGCRNVPFKKRFRVGEFPWIPDPADRKPNVEQFVYMATSRGLTAVEAATVAGRKAGVFSTALLEGLRGTGSAKVYRVAEQIYEVTAERLHKYLVQRVRDQIRDAKKQDPTIPTDFFQVPTLSGERFSDPVLAAFANVPEVALSVAVSPDAASSALQLALLRDQPVAQAGPPLPAAEHVFRVPPREYRLEVKCPSGTFGAPKMAWPLDLYSDQALPLAFTAMQTAVAGVGGGSGGRMPGLESLGGGGGPTGTTALLKVSSPDQLALLEVRASDETVVAAGRGSLEAKLPAGFYRVAMKRPEGGGLEELVSLDPGETEVLDLEAPGTRVVSERVGPLSWPRLSTILAIAAAHAPAPHPPHSPELRALGLRQLPELLGGGAQAAVHVLLGDERQEAPLEEMQVALWEAGAPPTDASRAQRSRTTGQVAEWAASVQPGNYWLSISGPGYEPTLFPLPVLKGRVSNLIVTRSDSGRVSVYAFAPLLEGDRNRAARMQRRLELAERYYANGQTLEALGLAAPDPSEPLLTEEDLLFAKWEDPIAGLLGAYSMLRLLRSGRLPEERRRRLIGLLNEASYNLTARFGTYPDAWVITAELARIKGDNSSESVRQAGLRGLPLFAFGFDLLAALGGVETERYGRRVAGLLWTAIQLR